MDLLVEDSATYEKLRKVRIKSVKNKLINTLKSWKQKGKISEALYHKLYPLLKIFPTYMDDLRFTRKLPLSDRLSLASEVSYTSLPNIRVEKVKHHVSFHKGSI